MDPSVFSAPFGSASFSTEPSSSIQRPFSFSISDSSALAVDKKPKKKEESPVTQRTSLTKFLTPWREVEWTEEERSELVEKLCSYAPCCRGLDKARVLLLGPVGSGKSSFISSVQSVLDGRVTCRAMVGGGGCSFTHKLQCFPLRGPESCAVQLWDSMGFGDLSGPSLHHLLSVVKGHAPHGYKFQAEQALSSETEGFIKRPGLHQRMHCVAFVLDASKVLMTSYSSGTIALLQQLRHHISDLGVHQVVLLTHVDQVCKETDTDISEVYNSKVIQETMLKAAKLVGLSPSSVVPVRNCWCELELDLASDVLLLRSMDLLLQYTHLYYREQQRDTHKDQLD